MATVTVAKRIMIVPILNSVSGFNPLSLVTMEHVISAIPMMTVPGPVVFASIIGGTRDPECVETVPVPALKQTLGNRRNNVFAVGANPALIAMGTAVPRLTWGTVRGKAACHRPTAPPFVVIVSQWVFVMA